MLAKVPTLEADVVVLDLEDGVSPDQKESARDLVARAVRAANSVALTFVRINPLDTDSGYADLARVVGPGLHGVMLPKAEKPSQLEALDHALREAEAATGMEPRSVAVAALIETPGGILNAPEIATCTRVSALCLGGEDLSLALGARRTLEGHELDFARSVLVTSAAASGLQAVDTVWTDVRDLEGLEMECRRTRDRGFTGKLAIHPGQLETIHGAYAPSANELAAALRIVEAFDGSADGVVVVDGRMIDAPVVERARRLIAAARPSRETDG